MPQRALGCQILVASSSFQQAQPTLCAARSATRRSAIPDTVQVLFFFFMIQNGINQMCPRLSRESIVIIPGTCVQEKRLWLSNLTSGENTRLQTDGGGVSPGTAGESKITTGPGRAFCDSITDYLGSSPYLFRDIAYHVHKICFLEPFIPPYHSYTVLL